MQVPPPSCLSSDFALFPMSRLLSLAHAAFDLGPARAGAAKVALVMPTDVLVSVVAGSCCIFW